MGVAWDREERGQGDLDRAEGSAPLSSDVCGGGAGGRDRWEMLARVRAGARLGLGGWLGRPRWRKKWPEAWLGWLSLTNE